MPSQRVVSFPFVTLIDDLMESSYFKLASISLPSSMLILLFEECISICPHLNLCLSLLTLSGHISTHAMSSTLFITDTHTLVVKQYSTNFPPFQDAPLFLFSPFAD